MIDLRWKDPSRWLRLRESLLSPHVDERELKSALATARARAAPPVVWLIGKTQSGKTSIIQALTGSPAAEIGNGFQPCTATARLFDFPSPVPLVRFLDTRGLGELAYDPAEDIRLCEAQAHLLLAVMKVADPGQEAVFEVLHEVRRRHPDWPLVIAQTGLHECYPPELEHRLPYPFEQPAWMAAAPGDLARALLAQREAAGKLAGPAPVQWVPVDLTRPEDGYAPPDYGLDALWRAIEGVSDLRLRRLMGADSQVQDVFARAAHPHILGYALAAGGVGALPLVDLALVPAIQAKMLQSLATLYGQDWDRRSILEFLGLLGTGVGAALRVRHVGRALVKLIPYLGQTAGALWCASASAAATYALGKAASHYMRHRSLGLPTDARGLRRLFAREYSSGARLLRGTITAP